MHAPFRAPFRLLLAVVVLLLAGCRTYGGYYDEEVIYEELVQATDHFENDLARRRAEAASLAGLAARQPALQLYATQYEAAVLVHEAAVAEARAMVAATEGSGDYRTLKRAFGAVVMNERTVTGYYNAIVQSIAEPYDTMLVHQRYYTPESRYFIVPPYYNRVRFAGEQVSLAAAVRNPTLAPPGVAVEPGPAEDLPTGPGGATTPVDSAAVDSTAVDDAAGAGHE